VIAALACRVPSQLTSSSSPPELTFILAYARDGEPLPEDSDGLLRLVGSEPARNERVGAIAEIIVNLPEAPAYNTDPISINRVGWIL